VLYFFFGLPHKVYAVFVSPPIVELFTSFFNLKYTCAWVLRLASSSLRLMTCFRMFCSTPSLTLKGCPLFSGSQFTFSSVPVSVEPLLPEDFVWGVLFPVFFEVNIDPLRAECFLLLSPFCPTLDRIFLYVVVLFPYDRQFVKIVPLRCCTRRFE